MAADSLQKAAKAAKREGPGRPRGRPFRKGQSGNPKGREPGSKNRKTLLAASLLQGEAEALVRKAVERALAGDAAALKLCLDRLIAPQRERAVQLALPPLDGAADLVRIMRAVTAGAAAGEITPTEAQALAQTVETAIRVIDASEFNDRILAVQERVEELEAKGELRRVDRGRFGLRK
ncbi:MAG TPA: DUF5681 domain-containing protein [Stellaceae bacterium]|nr:DUF5681 domain-containing protein [Stellaceae bacterium]